MQKEKMEGMSSGAKSRFFINGNGSVPSVFCCFSRQCSWPVWQKNSGGGAEADVLILAGNRPGLYSG